MSYIPSLRVTFTLIHIFINLYNRIQCFKMGFFYPSSINNYESIILLLLYKVAVGKKSLKLLDTFGIIICLALTLHYGMYSIRT